MNDNLPVNMEGQENGGTINYANEVIAIIAGMAMSEVDGVAGKRPAAKSVTERIGLTKAVNPIMYRMMMKKVFKLVVLLILKLTMVVKVAFIYRLGSKKTVPSKLNMVLLRIIPK